MSTGSPPNEKENDGYQPSLYKETSDKSNLNSLLSGEFKKILFNNKTLTLQLSLNLRNQKK